MRVGTRVTLTDGWLHLADTETYPEYGAFGTVLTNNEDLESIEPDKRICLLSGTGKVLTILWDNGMQSFVHESHIRKGEVRVPTNILKPGDKVMHISKEQHKAQPSYYPPVGTIGEVIGVASENEVMVKWEEGSTSLDDAWCVMNTEITAFERN